MAIADAKKRKIGRELIDWIYLGIRTGARKSVSIYEAEKAGDVALADAHLLRAVNMPVRARDRINEARRRYEQKNGDGTFNAFISSCLALSGTVTIAELNTELTSLESDSIFLKDQYNNNGWTKDQVSAWIQANWENEIDDWVFPMSATYTDSW